MNYKTKKFLGLSAKETTKNDFVWQIANAFSNINYAW